ncbi:hypothetical protein R1sor_008059 [Riccia sorocarpa]|uniref:Uncharacterized protein n=1 Tax=Riccia sorocarpa TaxID=122646 RepID=A0ABD3HSH9_9MARC
MALCTPEKINECLRFTCTSSRECMRKVNKKDVIDERSFFYNEPYSMRVEYILSKFDHPGFEDGYMLFRTLEVCKKTFWTLYGFVKQTFYNYEKTYKMGQRVGFHDTFKPKDTSIFVKACERRSTERAKLELDREKHQISGRTIYYSHRELSTSSPSLYLSFIHDSMDLAKTIIPCLCDKVKTLMRSVQPLPLKVIGIFNHGHEPGVVAHVTVGGLWKSDPNYTITSIVKQLRDYENFHNDKKLGDLHFTDQTSHPLFNALMDEEVFNTTVLAKKFKQIDG